MQASRQERKLDEQLETLQGNLADLKVLHQRLRKTLTGLGVPDPAGAKPVVDAVSTVHAEGTAGSSHRMTCFPLEFEVLKSK